MARRWSGTVVVALSVTAAAGMAAGQDTAPKRVFHLDSYHAGYSISDETAAGIKSVLAGKPVQVETFYLDTKRRGSEAEVGDSVARARAAIDKFKPHVLIASDDAAVKYVVVPFFKDGPIPVVFCGVNWSARAYGLPNANVTGMIEVFPVLEALDLVRKYYPTARRLGVLSEDSLSEQSNKVLLEPKYRAIGYEVTSVLVGDYTAWKREFTRLQGEVDVLYLPPQAAVRDWDAPDAKSFVRSTMRKPAIATDEFMMPYAVLGLIKSQVEQGEWAARAALAILGGTKPSDIPEARNRRRTAFLNPVLAKQVGFVPGPELESAKLVQ